MKSRAYRSTRVKDVQCQRVVQGHDGQDVVVGIDIGKEVILVILRWSGSDYSRPWRVKNPSELPVLVKLLQEVESGRSLKIALEPTGSYGDPLRQALGRAQLAVHRVSPKAVSDYAETFDGVPSQHDGKDAAVIAELAAIGKCWVWNVASISEEEQEIRYLVTRLRSARRMAMHSVGQLEALLARHWPEATREVKLMSVTLLKALSGYGSPAALVADEQGRQKLRRWGGPSLKPKKVDALVQGAALTVGMSMSRWECQQMRDVADTLLAYRRTRDQWRRRLTTLGKQVAGIQSLSAVVSVPTACVLWDALGDPKDYHCGAAYRKALGLNLAERSSGKYVGQLKISKRGPSETRRWLYLAALRWMKDHPAVRRWFRRQKKARRGESLPAIIGIMRKLALVCWQVGAQGMTFDPDRVFHFGKKQTKGLTSTACASIS